MPTVTVDESKIGQIVATDGKLIGITLKTVPTSYGNDYLSLVDGYYVPDADSNPVLVQELPMFNMHIASSPVSVDSVLMANGRDLFSNLTVKNCPPGCTFDIEYGTPPPPPTLTALNPDTAVS